MQNTFYIEGLNIDDIASFYGEINRVFMSDEEWKLGETLDGLNDMLYGDYGKLQGIENPKIIWENANKSKLDLGLECTIAYYQHKINQPEKFNVALFQEKLDALKAGKGQTYFDIIQEIFSEHQNIELLLV